MRYSGVSRPSFEGPLIVSGQLKMTNVQERNNRSGAIITFRIAPQRRKVAHRYREVRHAHAVTWRCPGVLVSALFLENFAPPFPEKEVRMGYGNVPQSGAGLHQTQIRVYLRSASKRNQCAWPERCQTGKLHGFKETGVIEDEGQYLQDGSYRRSFVSSASRRLCSHGAVNDSV